jgi:TolA-binding protein
MSSRSSAERLDRKALLRVGKRVASEQDQSGPSLDEDRGLARFREVVDAGVVQPKRSRRWLAAAFVAALMAVVAVFAWPRSSLTFAVEGGRALAVAEWIDAQDVTQVQFSDGTKISALTGSRWRVSDTTPVGATVQLERGELTADVYSDRDTRWLVDAGPFSIRVTGTQFTTSWNPVDEVFELVMHEGSVVLSGPVVGGQREVRAPEHLRVEVGNKKLALVGSSTQPSSAASAAAPEPPAANEEPEPAPETPAPPPEPSATADAAPKIDAWITLAQSGEYAKALARVQELNAASLVASESAPRLLLLAQTARLGGDQALAARALSALAKRFPDSVQAKTARFLAGKLHFDRGRYEQAVTELSAYTSSAPSGAFAGEAQVLLIVALHRSGRVSEARTLAGPYLKRHPDGPHAARIRSILEP